MKLRGFGHLHAEGNLSVYFGEAARELAERLTDDRARDGRPGQLVEVVATVREVDPQKVVDGKAKMWEDSRP